MKSDSPLGVNNFFQSQSQLNGSMAALSISAPNFQGYDNDLLGKEDQRIIVGNNVCAYRELPTLKSQMAPMTAVASNLQESISGMRLTDFQSSNSQSNTPELKVMQASGDFDASSISTNVVYQESADLSNYRGLQKSSYDSSLSKQRINQQLPPALMMREMPKMQAVPTGDLSSTSSLGNSARYVFPTTSSVSPHSFSLQSEKTETSMQRYSYQPSTGPSFKQINIPQGSEQLPAFPPTRLRVDGLQQGDLQHQKQSPNLSFQHEGIKPLQTSSFPYSQQSPSPNEGIQTSQLQRSSSSNNDEPRTLKMSPSAAYTPSERELMKPYHQYAFSFLSTQHDNYLQQAHQSPGLSPQQASDVLDSTKQVSGDSQSQVRQMSQQPQFSPMIQLPQQPQSFQRLGTYPPSSQRDETNFLRSSSLQQYHDISAQQNNILNSLHQQSPQLFHNSLERQVPQHAGMKPLQQQRFQNYPESAAIQHDIQNSSNLNSRLPVGFPPLPHEQIKPLSFNQNSETKFPVMSPTPAPSMAQPQHTFAPHTVSSNANQYMPAPSYEQQSSYHEYPLQSSVNHPAQSPSYGRTGFQQSPTQQIRKLDPDLLPSPIQVMLEDKEGRSDELFETGKLDVVPPLVSTPFIVQDTGNSSPRYIRSTMYSIPNVPDMLKQASIPFGLVITPLAKISELERPVLKVNTDPEGPTRCVRCKAYMSPLMQFIDGGRRFYCPLCKGCTEVPETYFQHLDHTGMRIDRFDRPELLLGTYEFIVPKEYCRDEKLPHPAGLLFMIDVTYTSIKSGMVKVFCREIRKLLKVLPVDQTTGKSACRVAFMTYNDTIQFYNLNPILGRPQILCISDISEVFVPLTEGLFCDPIESDANIECLTNEIPKIFGNTKTTESLLAPVVQAGLRAFQDHGYVGKIFVFHATLPSLKCEGKLEFRDDRQLLGSEKEKHALAPQISDYTNLGKECVANGVGVDMFICNTGFVDLPTIGQLCRITGGELYKYTYFDENVDGQRLMQDLHHNLTRETVYDAVLRVRTSTGIRPIHYYGDFHFEVSSEISLATINSDKAVAVELAHDDKLIEGEPVYVQVALLYTSLTGERRVRILNMTFNTCSELPDLFRNCELDTLMNYCSKTAVKKLTEATPRQVKDSLTARCVQLLTCYRKACASQSSSPGQLILPECMKLLPLYTNCLLKCDAIAGGPDMTVDDRWLMMHFLTNADISSSVVYLYPRVLPLINIDVHTSELPTPVRCTLVKLTSHEAYILENGVYLFIWIGTQVSVDWLKNVFGINRVSDITSERVRILPPLFDNPQSNKLHSILQAIARERNRSMKITILVENEGVDAIFKHYLVEDGVPGAGFEGYAVSYIDFLCFMHREVRSLTG